MRKINILYEDKSIIVVVKPSGVLSQSDGSNSEDMITIIKEYIKEKYQKPGNVFLGLVHRLDKPVAGIMVFAKNSKAASRLSEQIRVNDMQKNYYAVIHGIMPNKEGILVDKIEKIDNKKVLLNTKNGKEAKLEYKVIKEEENLSLVDIHLITGRYHQIRLQFSSRGYPLYGDGLYGSNVNSDLALYAYKLSFYHPITKEQLVFESKPDSSIFTRFLN